ncbi:hypothetical protein ACQKL5_17850 [Peribacillus sp. NPDC097675]|uniref:hypothetical protein n=1 Tax=Peribacillus sp. NPDC097675 TaxID=3390618 RepID=UPI003D049F1F
MGILAKEKEKKVYDWVKSYGLLVMIFMAYYLYNPKIKKKYRYLITNKDGQLYILLVK